MFMCMRGWCPRCQQGHQSCCLLLAHPLSGGHIANSGSGNTNVCGWGVCGCGCVRAPPNKCVCTLCLCGTLTGVGGTDHVTRPSHDCQRTGNLRRTGRERWQRTIPS